MYVLKAFLDAVIRPACSAVALQQAFSEQKRLDLFDLQCQSCGGLGIVADLTNRWYDCKDMSHHHGEVGWDCDPEAKNCEPEMVYGGKRCPECDGLGSPRV